MLDANLPYLGASPDCIVECDCCGKGCLEIKCLKTYEKGIPDPDREPHSYFLVNSDVDLKTTHKLYTQVQGHMLICNVNYCDAYFWSRQKRLAVRVFRDDEFLDCLKTKLTNEYRLHVLPALMEKIKWNLYADADPRVIKCNFQSAIDANQKVLQDNLLFQAATIVGSKLCKAPTIVTISSNKCNWFTWTDNC